MIDFCWTPLCLLNFLMYFLGLKSIPYLVLCTFDVIFSVNDKQLLLWTDRTHFKALYLYIHLLILCHNKVIRCLYHFFMMKSGSLFFMLFMKTDNYPFEMNTVLAFNSKMIFVFRGICLGVRVLMISDQQ